MKTILITIAIIFSGMLIQAQILVDGKNINELDLEYVDLVASVKLQATTTMIYIDYGQYDFIWGVLPKNNPVQVIKDMNEFTPKKGNIISALNLMTKNVMENL